MRYQFLIETYETERIKTLAVWRSFSDEDMRIRPSGHDNRGRNLLEQMIHQCVSENLWFINMFKIDVHAQPLPDAETVDSFIQQYSQDSKNRRDILLEKDHNWWEGNTTFFGETRIRAWVMTRRIAHSAHHRGQLTYLLRMLKKPLYSTYGPTADTGGLMANHAPTIYAYRGEESLLQDSEKLPLPNAIANPVTERPD